MKALLKLDLVYEQCIILLSRVSFGR